MDPEHIYFGGDALNLWLKKTFNRIVSLEKVPDIRDTRTQPSSSSSSQREADSQASSATVTLNLENWENWLDPEDLD